MRATLVGCSTVVAAGLFGVTDTATGPGMPGDARADIIAGERVSDDISRSATRGDGDFVKALRSPGPKPAASPTPTAEPKPKPDPNVKPAATAPLPGGSGSGHRVVYDISAQQVWLVDDTNAVKRTYMVSGSRYDQLLPGTYEVFSKSRNAVSWHGTETMEYMVRFHRGENSNIGFHDIPVATNTGKEVQTLSQLGTPLSDGCIRQDVNDALALWNHTSVGTPVVVVR